MAILVESSIEGRAEALRIAAAEGNSWRVAQLLHGITEEQRETLRKLALKEIQQQFKEIQAALKQPSSRNAEADLPAYYRLFTQWQKALPRRGEILRACRLAIVGIGGQREAQSALFNATAAAWIPEHGPDLRRMTWFQAALLLLDRPEPWTRDLLRRLVAHEERGNRGFWNSPVQLAVGKHLLGIGALPEEELLPAVSVHARRAGSHTYDWQDPLDLKIAWAVLEARDEPFIGTGDYGGILTDNLCKAAADGRMDRDALVALAIRRLGELSRGTEANWWARLLEKLEPAEADWIRCRDTALDLVCAPTGRAAAIGITAARMLLARGGAEPAEVLPLVSGAVLSETAGVAKGAVSLLRTLAAKDSSLREEGLLTALNALTHPKPAVHEAVLGWLERETWWRDEPGVLLLAADYVTAIAPAAAARLQRLLPEAESAERETPAEAQTSGAAPLRAVLAERWEREPDAARREWLRSCLEALDGGPLPAPLEPDPESWRSDPPLRLPESSEETARLMLQRDVMWADRPTMERVLAGMRLPLTPEERTHVWRLLDPVLGDAFVGSVAKVWLDPGSARLEAAPAGAYEFRERLRAAHQALRQGLHELPLCTPTQETGWLDPEVFAERLLRREKLPKEEVFELSAALYRLAPGAEARGRTWERLAPHLRRWGAPVEAALRLALAPDGERGGALATLSSLLAGKITWQWVRLNRAAHACRHGADRTPALTAGIFSIARGFESLFPEAFLHKDYFVYTNVVHAAFDFPAAARRLIERAFAVCEHAWSANHLWECALRIAQRRDVPLHDLLPQLLMCLGAEHRPVREAAAELLLVGLEDGRLASRSVVEAFGDALARREARPRYVLQGLTLAANKSALFREMAALCAERAVAAGLQDLTGAERAALLEALVGWRSAAGRAVETPEAQTALAEMAEGRRNRTTELARQLLDVAFTAGLPPSRELLAAHDVAAVLRRSPPFAELAAG